MILNNILPTIDLNPPGDDPKASVIWLHGLGADGNDFVPIVKQFQKLSPYRIRFVFPQAPIRSITVNGGQQMQAWYDIVELNLSQKEDREDIDGIKSSSRSINLLIEREQKLGIPANRIILIGFSQGGALVLYTGLRFPLSLAGIVVLSGYSLLSSTFISERSLANQSTPVFIAHGIFDSVVPFNLAQACCEQLKISGYFVDWHSYFMTHTVISKEIEDIERFIQKALHLK